MEVASPERERALRRRRQSPRPGCEARRWDFGYSAGLINLDRIVEALTGSRGDLTVTITRSDEPTG
jgi:hypothetical protein